MGFFFLNCIMGYYNGKRHYVFTCIHMYVFFKAIKYEEDKCTRNIFSVFEIFIKLVSSPEFRECYPKLVAGHPLIEPQHEQLHKKLGE